MITKLKTTIMALALLFSVTAVLVLSSCGGGDDEPEPEPTVKPDISYTNTEVAVGSTGTLTPTNSGDAATYAITDDGDADFVSIDANTGVLSVAAESKTGVYTVTVKATNSAGNSEATVDITIGVNSEFNPVGIAFLATYFMNRDPDLTFTGLDGIPGLPIADLDVPSDWPTGAEDSATLAHHFVMSELTKLIWNVSAELVCSENNTQGPLFIVGEDLSLNTLCQAGDPTGAVGSSTIEYKDGKYIFTMLIQFTEGIALPFIIGNAAIGEFTDFDQSTYQALTGTVAGFTTPTDFTDENTIQNITTWKTPTVDVVFKVVE